MKMKTDEKLDVGYVVFRKGKVAETVEIRPGVLLDLDSEGEVLGIEVLSLKALAPALLAGQRRNKANSRRKVA